MLSPSARAYCTVCNVLHITADCTVCLQVPPTYYPDTEYPDSYGSGGYHPKDIAFTLKEDLLGLTTTPTLGGVSTRRWVCGHLCARSRLQQLMLSPVCALKIAAANAAGLLLRHNTRTRVG